jgi:hypothetical protein
MSTDPRVVIRRYLDLDAQLKELNAQVKILKKEHKDLDTCLLNIMVEQNASTFETPQLNLIRAESQNVAPLTIPLLREVCNTIFSREEKTNQFLAAVAEHRKNASKTRVRLKHVKRKDVD